MSCSEDPQVNDRQATSRLIRRQRLFLWLTFGAAVVAVSGLAASTMIKSPAQLAASQGPPSPSMLTAPVRDQVLEQQVVVRGTVVAGGSIAVTPSAAQGASALIVTGEPLAPGSKVNAGQVIAQVSGRPIIALPGTTPAYRDLKPGDEGADITELQRALRSLGFSDTDSGGRFGPETKAAVKDLYQRLGYDPATTGGYDDQGDQETLQADAQAVVTAQHALTQAREQLVHDTAGSPDSANIASDKQTVQWDEQTASVAQQNDDQEVADTGYDLPMNEFVFIPEFPATLVAVNGSVGSQVAAPLLTIDTGKIVVDAVVQQSDHSLLRQGMNVEIDSEMLGQTAPATLSYLGPYSNNASAGQAAQNPPVAAGQPGQGNQPQQGSPGYPVAVTPAKPLDPTAWLGQDVRLTITAASTPGKVLTVPAAAISTGADAGTSVLVYDARTGATRQVGVSVGVVAAGMCEIKPLTPGALEAGDTVVTGQ